jgi:hypothetical protein
MIKLFEKCPACGGPIIVTECKCSKCQLQMRGEFETGQFSALSEDQLTFVKVFLRARGNHSEVEKVLGISYPTIRSKLDEINDSLQPPEVAPEVTQAKPTDRTEDVSASAEEDRRAILQQVATGKLSAAEAATKLQSLKGGQ